MRNTGTTPLTGVTATAALGTRRFTDRGQVGTWLTTRTETSGSAFARATSPATTLAPGASATITLTLPKAVWRLGRPFAAVPVDVQVSASGGATQQTRTIVPWVAATPEYVPLQLAWAAPLTTPADPRLFTSSGARTLTAWQAAIGPSSTVRERLAAAGPTPVTWFVDPLLVDAERFVAGAGALTETPRSTATPSASASPSAPTATSTAQAQAQARAATARGLVGDLVDTLRALPGTHTVWALPPGDPDTAALVASGAVAGPLAEAAYPSGPTPLDTALGLTVPRTTAWPADGLWSAPRESAWSRATNGYPMTNALVSTSSLTGAQGSTPEAVNRSAGGTGLLAYDEELSDIAGGTASHLQGLDRSTVVQRFLGESLVLLGEREGTTRGTVVALPRTSTVDVQTLKDLWAATSEAPWLRTTTLPALAAQLPTAPVATTRTPTGALEPRSPLTAQAVGAASATKRRLDGVGSILPSERSAYSTVWSAADAQLLGARWRSSSAGWSALSGAVDKAATSTTAAVQVAPATVNFLADAGAVAITVTNDLPYPVSNVHLRLTPGNGKLRVDEQPQPMTIQARSRGTVRVDVTALGSGEVPVVASLSAPDGTPLGRDETVMMNVRPPAEWILYVIGGAVALVLVAGLVRTLTRKPTRAVRDDIPAPQDLAHPSDQ